jgi:8-oxo-dGTP pyrophosphatase MutT (NUDIX family)
MYYIIMGKILFYLLWPLVWFYSPIFLRVRVIIKSGDEFLLVKNWFSAGEWQLPGGGMKFGEKPTDTAIREIKEELNINLNKSDLKQTTKQAVVFRQSGLIKRFIYFYVEIPKKPEILKSRELTDFAWLGCNSKDIDKDLAKLLSDV